MSRAIRMFLIMALCAALLPALPAAALSNTPSSPLDQCPNGVLPNAAPALYWICVPPQWNGDLVIFAHGYVAPNEPLTKFLEQLILPDGSTIPGLVLGQGYAFATTSYSKNGLAIKEGLADVIALAQFFKAQFPNVKHSYLIGASEGGLVTALAAEQAPQVFSGGLALCGPIGNFRSQINYFGDFRVLYDYFFPAARYPAIQIPYSPIHINEFLVWPNWGTISQGIALAVSTDTSATRQLLRTALAPIDPADPLSVVTTTVGILSYNVFATNEAQIELGGQPFDNRYRLYFGSDNDFLLNRTVQRFKADLSALVEIGAHYQTTGRLKMPLVTMHTTGDPIVPYWHEILYDAKVLFAGATLQHINIPIVRYGHCSFRASEALAAFAVLIFKVTGQVPLAAEKLLPNVEAQKEYQELTRPYISTEQAH